jgi:hypothetical protein
MKVRLYNIVFLFFLLSAVSFAQFRLSLGPQIGLNFNLHTGSDLPNSGNGFGMLGGGQVDMDFSRTIGLITNIGFYDNRYGSYSNTASVDVNGQTVNYTTDNNASLAYFTLEPLLKIKIPMSDFFFFVGPAVGFNIESSGERVTTLNTPGFTFQDGSSKQTSKATIQNTLVRFELKLGAGYNIPVGLMDITPQLSFGYGLTKVVSDVSWRILTIQASTVVKFRLI